MWKVSLICEGIYGVSRDLNLEETWNATLVMNVRDNHIDIQAEIYMTYLSELEEYDGLIDAIRYFAQAVKRKQDKEQCVVSFHCQGLSCFTGDKSWETFRDDHGAEWIDATFTEVIA
ncbi:MAG: hypothetical protein ACI4XS_03915 [Bacillus sp. (in: firmicutes)]